NAGSEGDSSNPFGGGMGHQNVSPMGSGDIGGNPPTVRGFAVQDDEDGTYDFGPFQDSVNRWGGVVGRPAPTPIYDSRYTHPRFYGWAMGLPDGWVTAVPSLTDDQQRSLCGNGVVPQQCEAAVRYLLNVRARYEVA